MFRAVLLTLTFPLFWAADTRAQGIGFAEAPDPLVAARWNNRLLVVCEQGDGVNDPPLVTAQYDTASWDWGGYVDRKLILVWLTPEDAMSWKPVPNPDPNKAATLLMRFHPEDKTGLVERTRCEAGFPRISLIGLDGGLKRTWSGAVSNEDLYALIDAMPMRAEELRNQDAE